MFNLIRYFSVTLVIGVVAVTVGLSVFYREVSWNALSAWQARNNEELARMFVNSLWTKYSEFVSRAGALSRSDLAARPEIRSLHDDVMHYMRGLKVAKVKIYDLNGLTVFSTEAAQIGEDKSGNAGVQQAKNGGIASEIVFRNRFSAFEGTIFDRNLIQSYIPVRRHETAPVEAVLEVYSDVTDLVKELDATHRHLVAGALAALAVLSGFLFLIVWRAHGIVRANEAALRAGEARAREQAYHDCLTRLPNRACFNERIEEAMRRARRTGKPLGVMFIDLDQFKLVNDSLGHDAGDLLLQAVAGRTLGAVRESDMVFRFGGDEFCVILEGLERAEDASDVARRVIDATCTPLTIKSHELIVTASIGITLSPNDGASPGVLLQNADVAMFRAKNAGRNRYRFYSKDMNEHALEELELETGLHQALPRREFVLHYQPRVSAATGAVVCVEALLRWRPSSGELVPPERFIAKLEATGLIMQVGEWVLEEACAAAKRWHDAGLATMRVSVNVSPREFRSEALGDTVKAVLERTGLEARFLELDLTESALVGDVGYARDTLRRLKELGVGIAIHDFGSGHGSIIYLKEFPVNCLQIGGLVTRDLDLDERARAIARAIINLGHELGMRVVAEGVETAEQIRHLRHLQCDELQGFALARPAAADAVFGALSSGGGLGEGLFVHGACA